MKGKLTGIPVAVVRGLTLRDDGSNGRTPRPGGRGGPVLARHRGGAGNWADARHSCCGDRSAQFSPEPVDPALVEAGGRRGAHRARPAPHPAGAVRLDPRRRRPRPAARPHEGPVARRPDRLTDGPPTPSSAASARGQILYDAPELVIPFMVPDGAHAYPDAARTAAEHTMFTVAAGAAVQALLVALAVRGSAAAGSGRRSSPRTWCAASSTCPRTGSPWAPSRSAIPPSSRPAPRDPVPTDGLLIDPMSLHGSVVDHAHRLAAARSGTGLVAPRRARLRRSPDPTPAAGRACRGTSRPRRWCSTTPAPDTLLTLHPRLGRWVQLGGHCEDGDADIAAAALREAREESGIDGLTIGRHARRPARARR